MNIERTLIHKGSTKDVYTQNENLVFKFSDRYSVFDWGEMPDHIPGKGLALANCTKKFYRELNRQGFATHLTELPVENDEIAVTPFKILRGDYTTMVQEENLFIPLEVIFRLGVGQGSSLLKRSTDYREGMRFEKPMIEFTTKLERFDRPLSHAEAKTLGGFRDGEWESLITFAQQIALFLQSAFHDLGIQLWDGKVEFAFGRMKKGQRQIILVDSIGPDELRLSKNDIQLSKEIMRQFYKRTPWYETMEEGKKRFGDTFKDHVPPPGKLPKEFLKIISSLYIVLAEAILSRDQTLVAKLDRIVEEIGAYQ
jgi:phosphoribosylaminoimidazole-succinocarboxamide synthase